MKNENEIFNDGENLKEASEDISKAELNLETNNVGQLENQELKKLEKKEGVKARAPLNNDLEAENAPLPLSTSEAKQSTTSLPLESSTVPPVDPTALPNPPNVNVAEGQKITLVYPKPRQCTKRCVRKEVLSATYEEVVDFINAFKQLAIIEENGKTLLDILVDEHLNNQFKVHGQDSFFPWHRYYLARLEQSLQKVNPKVCLLYWDWSVRPEKYWEDPIFSKKYFGSATTPGIEKPIPDGLLENFSQNSSKILATREFFRVDKEKKVVLLTSYMICYSLISQSKNFTDFHVLFSGDPHIGPHEFVGGDVKTMGAPMDPVFWLHHATLDMYWNIFQRKSDSNFFNYTNLSEKLSEYTYQVRDVMNTDDLCYEYAVNHEKLGNDFNLIQPPSKVSDNALKFFLGSNAEKAREVGKKAVDKAESELKMKKVPPKFLKLQSHGSSGSLTLHPSFVTLILASCFFLLT
ncbi:hypothetical protein HMI54_006403 [Coelomomyces lativittatus]|nr:hypothetical protein HMI54_006403 [Coelomomyces lativittatus]